MEWGEYKRITSSICRIITSSRRDIHNMHYRGENIFGYGCKTDTENHEDTHYFGRKFCIIKFTSQRYTVSTLLEEHPEQINTPICSAGTTYTLGSVEMVILVFGKSLWFAIHMDTSIIKPNQWRAYGISLWKEPLMGIGYWGLKRRRI